MLRIPQTIVKIERVSKQSNNIKLAALSVAETRILLNNASVYSEAANQET